jgi:hypothetical protein
MPESVRLEVTTDNYVQMIIVIEPDDRLCSICLENVQEDRRTPPCGHEFHGECLREWLAFQDTCPVCRATLPLDKLVQIFKTASNIRLIEEPSMTMIDIMTFFLLKGVTIMIVFLNVYSLRFILNQSNALRNPLNVLVVVALGAIDLLTLYFTLRKWYYS